MFSLKDMWRSPLNRNGHENPPSSFGQSLATIAVVVVILLVLSGFVWALVEFIKEKVG